MNEFAVELTALSSAQADLLRGARLAAPHALNPVSGFLVGAAVLTADSRQYRGTFFESSSFPLGVCAESAALAAAVTDGAREFEAIAIVGGDPRSHERGRPVTPCGGCRQRILDVAHDVVVLCANLDLSLISRYRIADLLPFAFSADDLPPRPGLPESESMPQP
ncbi:cytidine deaminase [Lentzea aerocolonigenes]|uniref:cytidine deaminase n=1 Tax=Lentzea aerocolonigenes TaxID=68170 RepID=UPI0006918719|nr:cytidine deaminase [Lentzea aerocolonigenes]MCP2242757.1 cytidine deaminase [Lentzea aerocolonigenes]